MRFIGRFIWLLITLIAVTVAMLFATSNTEMVTIKLWPFANVFTLSLWILVLGTLAVGALIGSGLVWMSLIAAKARNWRLTRQLSKAEMRASKAEKQLLDADTEDNSPDVNLAAIPKKLPAS